MTIARKKGKGVNQPVRVDMSKYSPKMKGYRIKWNFLEMEDGVPQMQRENTDATKTECK